MTRVRYRALQRLAHYLLTHPAVSLDCKEIARELHDVACRELGERTPSRMELLTLPSASRVRIEMAKSVSELRRARENRQREETYYHGNAKSDASL